MQETDEIIYRRFMEKRDEEDLRILLERYRDPLTFFLYGFVHSMEDAEELMIDSFAQIAAARSPFSGKSTFKTWLYAVARNQARMLLRKKRHIMVPLEEVPETEDPDGEDPSVFLLRDERSRRLHRAMQSLPPESRQILYLFYFEDMSYEEIARVLGKSRRQTYKAADRSRAKLKNVLEEEGYHEIDR